MDHYVWEHPLEVHSALASGSSDSLKGRCFFLKGCSSLSSMFWRVMVSVVQLLASPPPCQCLVLFCFVLFFFLIIFAPWGSKKIQCEVYKRFFFGKNCAKVDIFWGKKRSKVTIFGQWVLGGGQNKAGSSSQIWLIRSPVQILYRIENNKHSSFQTHLHNPLSTFACNS